jgi:lipoprotein signal peptidase
MGLWGILSVIVAVCLADRVTKSLALDHLSGRGSAGVLRLSVNRRLPLAPRASPRALATIWLGSVACAGLAMALSPALRAEPIAIAGSAAAIAGASSNLLDWIRRGAIIDFISFGWWPAFNLADAAIVMGGVLAGVALLP